MIQGDAATTLAAMRTGTPTVVVPLSPFQESWASAMHRARAGRKLSRSELVEPAMLLQALQFCASHECAAAADTVRTRVVEESTLAAGYAVDAMLADLARLPQRSPP